MDAIVKDIMTRDITAVEETYTMLKTTQVLAAKHYSGVPVVDKDNRVIGFISVKDILLSQFPERIKSIGSFSIKDYLNLARQYDYVGESKVINFMNTKPVTVTEKEPLSKVIKMVAEDGIKIIPVVRDGEYIGVVERIELCRYLMEKRIKL